MLNRYDAGLLNDFGGGNAELECAHDFYAEQVEAAERAERLGCARAAAEAFLSALTAAIGAGGQPSTEGGKDGE